MKPRIIRRLPTAFRFVPAFRDPSIQEKRSGEMREPVLLTLDEMEALRLVDYEGMIQEEAAKAMGVSRGTLWRCLDSARRKVARSVVEGRELVIEPVGEVLIKEKE